MAAWRFRIPPDLNFTVRTASAEPKLLSRTFGPAVEASDKTDASLVLDLAAPTSSGESTTTARGVYKAVPWSCSIARTEEEPWTIAFRSLVMREYLAMHIVLLPALRHVLTKRNSALILGAAYEQDGGAIVLTGPTGTGKTSLLTAAIGQGARFIGDEYVGLNSAGQCSPIVRSLALRRSTLDLASDAARRLMLSRRIALRLAEAVTSLTRGRVEPLSHLRPEEIGMNIAEGPMPVKHLVWLEQSYGDAEVTLAPMANDDVVHELSQRQAVHQRAYSDITPFLESVAGGGDAEANWRKVLSESLSSVECLRLQFPPDERAAAFKQLEQLGQQ